MPTNGGVDDKEDKENDAWQLNFCSDDSQSVDLAATENDANNHTTTSDESENANNSCNSILMKARKHCDSVLWAILHHESDYKAGLDLLAITKKTGLSVYVFNNIMKCAKNSARQHRVNFSDIGLTQKKKFEIINQKYDLNNLKPKTTQIYCKGYGGDVDVVWHNFDSCLYSLLMDRELMKPENLVWNEENEESQNPNMYDDVNTGSVYKEAVKRSIVNPENEKLIPIFLQTKLTQMCLVDYVWNQCNLLWKFLK